MSSSGGRQPSQSRAIPTRTVTLSDAAQLPADYCTTPGGTLFSTTPGGKSAAPAGASAGARPGPAPPPRAPRVAGGPCLPRLCPLRTALPGPACRPFSSAHPRGDGAGVFSGRVGSWIPARAGSWIPAGRGHRALGASALPRPASAGS